MKSFGEEELIAYHLGELSWWKRQMLRRRLEVDATLAAESEEIADTLRVFAAEPVPVVSDVMRERSWRRVHGSLSVLDAPRRSRRTWMWAAGSVGAVAVIAIVAVVVILRVHTVRISGTIAEDGAPSRSSSGEQVPGSVHGKPDVGLYGGRPGPLTTVPVDAVAEDPALAAHLDAAERVLTEASHADGPLQPEMRDQVHRLLLENAVYRQSAEQHGDMGTAAVIDDLGRVLTSLDAEPLDAEKKEDAKNPDAFRLEMNLGGVLLDLRILHHNQGPNEKQ